MVVEILIIAAANLVIGGLIGMTGIAYAVCRISAYERDGKSGA